MSLISTIGGGSGSKGDTGFGLQGDTGSSGPKGDTGEQGATSGQLFWFHHDAASDCGGCGYEMFRRRPSEGVEVDEDITCAVAGIEYLVDGYITNVSVPNLSLFPVGLWQFHLYGFTSANTANFIIRVFKREAVAPYTETEIFNVTSANFTNTSVAEIITNYTYSGTTLLNATDRIVVKIYAKNSVNGRHVHFVYEGATHVSYAITSFSVTAPQGDTGSAGAKGDTGANSTVKGDTGTKGDTGSGLKGDTGAASTVKGDTGTKGDTGSGLTGDTGSIGVKGDTGTKGDTGVQYIWRGTYAAGTAYVVNDCVEYGNSGYVCIQNGTGQTPSSSPTYWNVFATKGDTGVGTTGDTGTSGAKGDTGTAGTKGDTGTAGTKGDTGAGTKGDTGTSGAKGDTGTAGTKGDTGAGTKGDTGTAGAKGDTGTAGAKGDTGAFPLQLTENNPILLDELLSDTDKYSGMVISGTAGATLAFGNLCYKDPTDSRWEKADANAAAGADGDSRGLLGICVLAAANDGDATKMLLWGNIRADSAFPVTLTVNNPLYVSETAGAITHTQPTTTDVVIRVIGFAHTAYEVYFNPDNSYITHT
jgi:hypothetical protein